MTDNNLIIIASQPRSGSTLLQALLSNNRQVATVSEPWLLLPFLSYKRTDLVDAKYSSDLAVQGIEDFKSKINTKTFNQDLANFLLNQYHQILKNEEQFALDKTPRYYEILDEIVEVFPKAKIIILKRNPFAVLASMIGTWNHKDISKLSFLKRDILEAPKLLQQFSLKHTNNPNVKTVLYENILRNPQKEINNLYNWIEIQYNDDVLNYSSNDKYKGKMGDPKGIHNNSKPTKEILEKWKEISISKQWKQFFMGYANYLTEDFLTEYGSYETIPHKQTKIFNHFLSSEELVINNRNTSLLKRVFNYLAKAKKK